MLFVNVKRYRLNSSIFKRNADGVFTLRANILIVGHCFLIELENRFLLIAKTISAKPVIWFGGFVCVIWRIHENTRMNFFKIILRGCGFPIQRLYVFFVDVVSGFLNFIILRLQFNYGRLERYRNL